MKRALPIAVALTACTDLGPPEVTAPVELGGVEVDAATLNRGRTAYNKYCSSCHGLKGDGMGPLGYQQEPRARDLRLGIIKFGSVPAGHLPTDADLVRITWKGIPGTSMLGWHVQPHELRDVVQWVKYLSPRFQRERPGKAVEISADPWAGRTGEARARGRALYHGELGCAKCHPSYDASLAPVHPVDARDSVFGPIKPTDFRSAKLRGGASPQDLYRAIAAGVGGTAMPSWKGATSEENLWALVYYVDSLRLP